MATPYQELLAARSALQAAQGVTERAETDAKSKSIALQFQGVDGYPAALAVESETCDCVTFTFRVGGTNGFGSHATIPIALLPAMFDACMRAGLLGFAAPKA